LHWNFGCQLLGRGRSNTTSLLAPQVHLDHLLELIKSSLQISRNFFMKALPALHAQESKCFGQTDKSDGLANGG
jgi:hypothetical protein